MQTFLTLVLPIKSISYYNETLTLEGANDPDKWNGHHNIILWWTSSFHLQVIYSCGFDYIGYIDYHQYAERWFNYMWHFGGDESYETKIHIYVLRDKISDRFYKHWLTIITAWIGNYIHYKAWDEITYPFQTSTVQTGMDMPFHPTLYWACDCLPMPGLKLIYGNKRGPRKFLEFIQIKARFTESKLPR